MDMRRLQANGREVHIDALPAKSIATQPHKILLYSRALHPELFQLKSRRVHKKDRYELEAWLMHGMHVLRFAHNGACVCELVTDQERSPVSGIVAAYPCAGEREIEHTFEDEGVTFMTSIQTENLNEHIYDSTHAELCTLAHDTNAQITKWTDEHGRCLSIIDVQEFPEEIHIQCYHMLAANRLVIRTQTIFEHA